MIKKKYEHLRLYRPLITNKITQDFGEARACINTSTGSITTKRNGVCPVGYIDFYKEHLNMKGHNGKDLKARRGEKIFHMGTYDGWLHIDPEEWGEGLGVDVISNERLFIDAPVPEGLEGVVEEWEQDGKQGFLSYVKTRHWHCLSAIGYEGQQVKLGKPIALADNTGASSGDHDHVGAKLCDKDGKTYLNGKYIHNGKSLPSNGYTGAFDFTKWFYMDTDAKTAAEYLYRGTPALSDSEREQMLSRLSAVQKLLNLYQELQRLVQSRIM